MKEEAPATGNLEATLASCFASNAWPAPEVTWRLGDLENSLKTETNHTAHPNRTITVVSFLLGVPSKRFNKKNVQCVVKHITLREDLVMNYTINIHCKYNSLHTNDCYIHFLYKIQTSHSKCNSLY